MKIPTKQVSFTARYGKLATVAVLTIIAAAVSGCASDGPSANRTHEMGPIKSPTRMTNESMPNYPGR